MLARRNFVMLAFCAIQSLIVPGLLMITKAIPAHDARAKFEIWFAFANSFALSNQPPVWVPNWDEGVNTTHIALSLNGIDYLMVSIIRYITQDASIVFAIYVFLNTFLTSLAIASIFNLLRIDKIWALAYITINACTIYSFWQIYFNLLGVQRLLLAYLVVVAFLKSPSANTFWMFVGYIFIIQPYGYITYFTPLYIATLTLFAVGIYLYFVNLKGKEFAKGLVRKQGRKFKASRLIIITSSLFSVFYYVNNVIIFSNDSHVLTPGRTRFGFSTLENQLNYGGDVGVSKFLELIGLNWNSASTSPDIMMTLGPIFPILLLVSIYSAKKVKNADFNILLRLVFLIILVSLPFVPVVAFLYYTLPGFAFVRHLSSLAVLLIPLFVIMVSIIWSPLEKTIEGKTKYFAKKNPVIKVNNPLVELFLSKKANRVLLSIVIGIVLSSSTNFLRNLEFEQIVGETSQAYGLLFVLQSFSFLFTARSQEGLRIPRDVSRKNLLPRIAPHLFVLTCLFAIYTKGITQYDYFEMNNENYLKGKTLNVAQPLPREREFSSYQAESDHSTVNSGAIYISRNSVLALDNCGLKTRKDVISQAIYESTQKQGSFIENVQKFTVEKCEADKSRRITFVDRLGSSLLAEYRFVEYGYNLVKVEFKLKSKQSSEFALVYRDAYSNADLWSANLDEKTRLVINKSRNGYKSVELVGEAGTVTFKIKNLYIFILELKILLDIFWILILFVILIRQLVFRSERED